MFHEEFELETRNLMAVTTAFNPVTGILSLTGDAAADTVDIEGNGKYGGMEVYVGGVLRGTFLGVRSIQGIMGPGNDVVNIAAVALGGGINIHMGKGENEVDIDNTPDVGASLDDNVFIGGSLTLSFGPDVIDRVDADSDSATHGLYVGRNVTINNAEDVDLNGDGTTFGVEVQDFMIGGTLVIGLSLAGSVLLDDVNVGGVVTITGSEGIDTVTMTDSSFVSLVSVALRGGNDTLDIDGGAGEANIFQGGLVVRGGLGTDTFDTFADNVFGIAPTVAGIESTV